MADSADNQSLKLHFSKFNVEPETKFLTDKATVDRMLADLEAMRPFVSTPVQRDERTNIYYDTNAFRLYRIGYECRGRKFGDDEFRYDMKRPSATGSGLIGPDRNGVHLRDEFNRVSDDSEPSLRDFSKLGLENELKDFEDKELVPWVKGYFKRQRLTFMPVPGSKIEIAFENGYYQTINNRHKSDEMWIVELELKEGSMSTLVDTANMLRQKYGLKVCVKTKGEMGLEFARQFMDADHQAKFDKSTTERSAKYSPLRRQLG